MSQKKQSGIVVEKRGPDVAPSRMRSLSPRTCLILILIAYTILAGIHVHVTPYRISTAGSPVPIQNFINAPDEEAHFQYVREVSAFRLPTKSDTYEWHQPPLYYTLAAPFYLIHPLAVRWLSVLLGLGGILIAYRLMRLLLQDKPWMEVLAAGLVAFLPMRQAVFGSAGNDPLLELMVGFTIVEMLSLLRNGLRGTSGVRLGGLIGLALLTKLSALALLPLSGLLILALWKSGEKAMNLAKSSLIGIATAVVFISPWIIHISRASGTSPLQSFNQDFANTAKASDWIGKQPVKVDHATGDLSEGPVMSRSGYTSLIVDWTFRTSIAAYTPPGRSAEMGAPKFMPSQFYLLPFLILLVAGSGFLAAYPARTSIYTLLQRQMITILTAHTGLVLLSFFFFTWTYFQAQGRYLFPALPSAACLIALGIRKAATPRYFGLMSTGIVLLLFALSLAFITNGILPAYAARQ